ARDLSGRRRDRAPAPRHGQHRRPRVGILLGARAGARAPLRLLRGGVHQAARDVRRRGADRGGRVPRHRRGHVRAEGDDQRTGRKRRARMRNMVALALALALTAAPALAQPQAPRRVLVMPFENTTRDGRIFWLTEAAAVALTDDLDALGVSAIARKERQQAFERLQVPPAAALSDATVIRIGQIVGAADVVVGSLQLDGEALVVRARSIALESGRIQTDVTERGPLVELFATFERIARRMAPPLGRSSEDVERQHPPVAAFEDYIKGLLAETPATAVAYLEGALARQPSFDRARVALWDGFDDQGDHENALAAVGGVPAASPLARTARFMTGLSQLYLKKYDDAFATFKALADVQATPAVLNNLGVVQLR